MILSICNTPEILQVSKYVKLAIDIIKILVPILLIISLMLNFIGAMTGKSDDDLGNALKSSVNKILAAVLVFLVPTLINMIFATLDAKSIDFAACLNNATEENITASYVSRAQRYVQIANESLLRSDYSLALSAVNKIDNKSEKAKLNNQLETVEEKITEREKEEIEKNKSGIRHISNGEYYNPLGDYEGFLTACFSGDDEVHRSLGGGHGAVDLSGSDIFGKPVYAAKSGKVLASTNRVASSEYPSACGTSRSCGNYVTIDHQDGTATKYCHMKLDSILVKTGDIVTKGQQIGEVGSTGCSTGAHLHFNVFINDTPVDPIDYVEFNVTNPDYCS